MLAHIGGSEARRILTDHLLEADVILRFRVIAALNKLHQLHPDIELDRRPIETVLTAEIMGHYRSYQIMGKLGDAFEHADPVALSLKQSMDHEVERIFRLMQRCAGRKPTCTAPTSACNRRTPSVRANALEFLDNILQPQVRSLIVPLLDSQVSVSERVALANRLLGTLVETPEQAVAALVASDDPWMRASGAYAIGMLRLTSLALELDRLATTGRSPPAGNRPRRPRKLSTTRQARRPRRRNHPAPGNLGSRAAVDGIASAGSNNGILTASAKSVAAVGAVAVVAVGADDQAEGFDDLGVELVAFLASRFPAAPDRSARVPVRAAVRQGVEDVGDGDDAGGKGDGVAFEAVQVAAAVPALVMREGDLFGGLQDRVRCLTRFWRRLSCAAASC